MVLKQHFRNQRHAAQKQELSMLLTWNPENDHPTKRIIVEILRKP